MIQPPPQVIGRMPMHKARLRNTLKKLQQLPFDRSNPVNVAMAPQETLDFLAMLVGLKPVCLVGRGFDDPDWIAGILTLAEDKRLHVVRGSKWHAQPEYQGLPDWYANLNTSTSADDSVVYISKSRTTADKVRQICDSGAITMEQEGELLGYPLCCVKDHYYRNRCMHDAFSLMLHRSANGDEAEMKRIVRDDIGIQPETEEERTLIEQAVPGRFAPYTSINICPDCADDANSPAMCISKLYRALAERVDPGFAREVALNAVPSNSNRGR